MRRVAVVVAGGLLAWALLVTPLSVGVGEYFAYQDLAWAAVATAAATAVNRHRAV